MSDAAYFDARLRVTHDRWGRVIAWRSSHDASVAELLQLTAHTRPLLNPAPVTTWAWAKEAKR